MQYTNIIRKERLYHNMEIDIEDLKEYFIMKEGPPYIEDPKTARKAIVLLNKLEELTGKEYAFFYFQQRTLGGHCSVEPADYDFKENAAVFLLGKYGREFFEDLEKRLST